jgi:GntR family transcriptional regulator
MEGMASNVAGRRRREASALVEHAILLAVLEGRLQPGDRLPTVRQLAVQLRANANVVADAYAALEATGLLGTAPDGGTLVRWDGAPRGRR